jgi:hypothetical protein
MFKPSITASLTPNITAALKPYYHCSLEEQFQVFSYEPSVTAVLSSAQKGMNRELNITEKEEWTPICATEKIYRKTVEIVVIYIFQICSTSDVGYITKDS